MTVKKRVDIPPASEIADCVREFNKTKSYLDGEQQKLSTTLEPIVIVMTYWEDNLSSIIHNIEWLKETWNSFLIARVDETFTNAIKAVNANQGIRSMIDKATTEWKYLLDIIEQLEEKWYEIICAIYDEVFFFKIDIPQI